MDSRDVIACVKKYQIVYDTSSQRTHARRDAWKAVAAELGTDVATAQRKWKNLRDSYVKYLNNASMAFRMDAEMAFLKKYLQKAKSPTESASAKNSKPRNVPNRRKQVEEADSDEESTSLKRSKRKVKRGNYNQSDPGSETESVSAKNDKPINARNSRKQVEEVDSDYEESTSLKRSKRKVKRGNYNQSDSGSETESVSAKNDKPINARNSRKQVEEVDSDYEESTSLERSKRKVKRGNYNQSDSGSETESVSAKNDKPINAGNSRKQVEEVDSDYEESTSRKTSKGKVNSPNVSSSDSSIESSVSSDDSDSSTYTINDEIDHLQLDQSKIINSAMVDENFVEFADRVKKLSQDNILTILNQFSKIIDEKIESERSHSKIKIKLK